MLNCCSHRTFIASTALSVSLFIITACTAHAPVSSPMPPTGTVFPPTATSTWIATLTPSATPTATITATPTFTPIPPPVRFAAIGDYGQGNQAEADVAALIHSWQPDIIITLGDNNYPSGAADTIDANIGQYYSDFIFPYSGAYGQGADVNRFFPSLGNHDWVTDNAQPYFDYFHSSLPGNERYYDFTWGPVHFFALDSDDHEPDGVGMSSVQAGWFQYAIATSTSAWNIVYFHHPPYSSGYHGSTDWMRWPFAAWGADAVLSGHDHSYERLLVDGIPYFVNGLGGGPIYTFNEPTSKTQYRYNDGYGALLVTATMTEIKFEFYTRQGVLKDSYTVTK